MNGEDNPEMFIVVTYDIPLDRRRTKLHKQLKNFGEPVQFSVFECNLTPKQKQSLRMTIEKNIKKGEDRVRIYELCSECKGKTAILGEGRLTEDSDILFV